ncbi:AraC family transcriptional regulator [Glaciecola sp. MH2013]|uniref:helix-turn-helix transcriptional regulator n=1 Tax=Glaciecola sp. MH2013 TaxID=2785524 RepID=UPI00189CBA45|nr:AraC family transcriptional regulator [Glaciecola sp. MH2013]MBF7071950.1 AraC family transcriptional regulator [Glaciecola sp. MH2013]
MDRLSEVLNRFSMDAGVFFTGNLCGMSSFELNKDEAIHGHLHVLKQGKLKLIQANMSSLIIDQPSVLFFPQGKTHRFESDPDVGADLVCAAIHYQSVGSDPIASALPELIHYPLNEKPALARSALWLFEEAFAQNSGREPMINRLCDIFIIQILREVLEDIELSQGMLAGLSHPQIGRLLATLHQSPQTQWTLEMMAQEAGMSRSKFASLFKTLVGKSPGEYLADWRMTLAQSMLKKNQSVGIVAHSLGYDSGSALARVFRKRVGMSPKEWLKSVSKIGKA